MAAITNEFALRELMKLESLRYAPQTEVGMGVLVEKLVAVSRSQAHCEAIIHAILENPGEDERWPIPKALGDIAWSLLTEKEKYPVGCDKCNGTFWIHYQHRYQIGASGEWTTADCVRPCECTPPKPAAPIVQKKERKARPTPVMQWLDK